MSSAHEARDSHLRAQLLPGETVVAAGASTWVTERRILFAWRVLDRWTHDAVAFREVTGWSEGSTHDERPLIRLEHPPHLRLESGPAHRFLWFQWGNAEQEIARSETTLSLKGRGDPVFLAIRASLERTGCPKGDAFRIVLPGTREERIRGTVGRLKPAGPLWPLGRSLRRFETALYRGRIKWWIRVASWALLAVPLALLLGPWFALPAVLLVEAAWIAALQRAWHRLEPRRRFP